MINLGEKIKTLREEAQLSQDDLAKLINASQQSVSRWENNVTEPSISFCVALADYFQISLDTLVGRNSNNKF